MGRKSTGVYPPDWGAIAQAVKDESGWRCVRCGHPHDIAAGRMLTVHHLDLCKNPITKGKCGTIEGTNEWAGALLETASGVAKEGLVPMQPQSTKPCAICERPYYPLRRGRCQPCYQYWKRHGQERPASVLKCICGSCSTCRNRDNARRRYHGMVFTNLAVGRFQESRIVIPTDPATLGYLAGLMDGEGCITRQNNSWRVQIAMTDEPIIRWLGTLGGRVSERKRYGEWNICWQWLVMRQLDVYVFLSAILPYLRVKRDQAVIALAQIDQRNELRFVHREVA